MKKFITRDGSATLYSEEYNEHYHQPAGAKQEAIEKYVVPSMIAERDDVTILDVCFGLGYNSAAAIDAKKDSAVMKIVALEKDVEVLKAISSIPYPFKCERFIDKLVTFGFVKEESVEASIIVGDARKTIKELFCEFNVVFFDPFSPKKCPELWTIEFFKQVYNVMKKGGILITYSCARQVRDTMREAGFIVENGPKIGRRGPGTIGRKV